jgi:hypothetical protein
MHYRSVSWGSLLEIGPTGRSSRSPLVRLTMVVSTPRIHGLPDPEPDSLTPCPWTGFRKKGEWRADQDPVEHAAHRAKRPGNEIVRFRTTGNVHRMGNRRNPVFAVSIARLTWPEFDSCSDRMAILFSRRRREVFLFTIPFYVQRYSAFCRARLTSTGRKIQKEPHV